MSVRAEIHHVWADGATTTLKLSTDSAPHPDLLDEIVTRIEGMWREVCVGEDDG